MKAIQHLQLRSNCLYLGGGEDHAEKLSGGFYDHTFIPEYAGGYSRHKYFAITYIIKGYGIFKDHLSRSFNYREGDLVLRHADTPFYMSKHFRADGWLEFSAALPQSLSDALLAAGVLRKNLTFLSPGISPALLGAAEAYTDSLFCINKSTGAARAYAAILNFFDELAGSTTPGVFSGNRKEMQRLERIKQLLDDVSDTTPLPQLARSIGMGYENFRKSFRRWTGLSPQDYRIQRRLNQADALLLHTRLSIKEIAERLGYSDITAFSRQYRKFRRVPPSSKRDLLPPAAGRALPPGTPPLDTDAGYGFEPAARPKAPGQE